MGHGSARISRALGVREETIQRLVRGDGRTITPALRDAIADLYDAWWDKRAPERTRAERAAAARARRRPARELVRAPAPPSMTTSSTSPATAPAPATAQPGASASPRISACPSAATGGKAHDR